MVVDITILAGGTGAAKLLRGLAATFGQDSLRVIVNTGDDFELYGQYIAPDLDSVTYGLAGILSRGRGWGIEGDTWNFMGALERLGEETWFRLGDRDLATHVHRTALLRSGMPLSEATAVITKGLGVRARILPMSDQRVGTWLDTSLGPLPFQEYFVKHRAGVEVQAVHYGGALSAKPGPGVLEAIAFADAVVVAPSNPVTSIGPILAVPGIRQELRETQAPVVAVSPIVGDRAVSGPAHRLMRAMGWEASLLGVAKAYNDFLRGLVCEETEARTMVSEAQALGLVVLPTRTIMASPEDEKFLASRVVEFGGTLANKRTR